MGFAQDLVNAGFYGYAGWGDAEAAANFQATGGKGKGSMVGGGSSGGFGFNFEAEVNKAFDELGAYYDEILTESKGDLNLALSRLKEDYDTGVRFRKTSFDLSSKALDLAQESATENADYLKKRLDATHLERGISRTSAFDPFGGRGIADEETARLESGLAREQEGRNLQRTQLTTGLSQAEELAKTSLGRTEYDLTEAQRREARDLEERRKLEAANMATSRAQRAYNRFEASLI